VGTREADLLEGVTESASFVVLNDVYAELCTVCTELCLCVGLFSDERDVYLNSNVPLLLKYKCNVM
jgi:hypothetical protein